MEEDHNVQSYLAVHKVFLHKGQVESPDELIFSLRLCHMLHYKAHQSMAQVCNQL